MQLYVKHILKIFVNAFDPYSDATKKRVRNDTDSPKSCLVRHDRADSDKRNNFICCDIC